MIRKIIDGIALWILRSRTTIITAEKIITDDFLITFRGDIEKYVFDELKGSLMRGLVSGNLIKYKASENVEKMENKFEAKIIVFK